MNSKRKICFCLSSLWEEVLTSRFTSHLPTVSWHVFNLSNSFLYHSAFQIISSKFSPDFRFFPSRVVSRKPNKHYDHKNLKPRNQYHQQSLPFLTRLKSTCLHPRIQVNLSHKLTKVPPLQMLRKSESKQEISHIRSSNLLKNPCQKPLSCWIQSPELWRYWMSIQKLARNMQRG